jgi:hypothetical protein
MACNYKEERNLFFKKNINCGGNFHAKTGLQMKMLTAENTNSKVMKMPTAETLIQQ